MFEGTESICRGVEGLKFSFPKPERQASLISIDAERFEKYGFFVMASFGFGLQTQLC